MHEDFSKEVTLFIEDFLDQLTYKPNFEIAFLEVCPKSNVNFIITMKVLDPLTLKQVSIQFYPSLQYYSVLNSYKKGVLEKELKNFFYQSLIEAETHEVREWLKFNGSHYINPH